ncbi:MAG: hypothetical protein R3E79_55235 [Caldilineaceae bacterium]
MRYTVQPGIYGALLLAACLIGYAIYEMILYPNAGFPTTDFGVIVAGADTLRIGHWLKSGYALSIALLMTSIQPRLQRVSPTLAQLGLLAGASAIILFLASGHIGLRILATAEATFATNPDEAIATILLRTVTIALFEAAGFAVGCYLLVFGVGGIRYRVAERLLSWVGGAIGLLFIIARFLSNELALIAPLATIGWSLWLAATLWQAGENRGITGS